MKQWIWKASRSSSKWLSFPNHLPTKAAEHPTTFTLSEASTCWQIEKHKTCREVSSSTLHRFLLWRPRLISKVFRLGLVIELSWLIKSIITVYLPSEPPHTFMQAGQDFLLSHLITCSGLQFKICLISFIRLRSSSYKDESRHHSYKDNLDLL